MGYVASVPVAFNLNLALYVSARVLVAMAVQVQAVALGWFVYLQTGSAMSVGLIGLAQFLPSIPMLTIAGYAADHFDRRKVIIVSQLCQAIAVVGLCLTIFLVPTSTILVYLSVIVIAACRSISTPSLLALLPAIVPREQFPRAIATNSSASQLATIIGPWIGGFGYALMSEWIFIALLVFPLAAVVAISLIRVPPTPHEISQQGKALERMLAGLAYVRSNRLLLGLMLLDLFAVLFGGINALLPIFAHDILHIGASGLGLLTSGPAIGAVTIGLLLSVLPINRRAGPLMLSAVATYGLAIVIFGLSTNFYLSLGALIVSGGCDMVSLVVRQTILQTATPDSMRGRVSAVNMIFTGASGQLGNFESGVVASLIGAAPAAIFGGVASLVVVGAATLLFPEIRKRDRIHSDDANAAAAP